MIDITQGLVSELKQITDSSGVGAHIYQAALPIAPDTRQVADEMKEDVDKYALYGGEDLELMFTLPEEQLNEYSEILKGVNVIGKIDASDSGVKMQTGEGDLIQFEQDN
jgi:thiamine-monophosphate kinase